MFIFLKQAAPAVEFYSGLKSEKSALNKSFFQTKRRLGIEEKFQKNF